MRWFRSKPNDRQRLLKAVRRWSKLGELRLCYEASGTGFVIKRWLDEEGVHCDVIAPSLIPKAPGDRVKTDKRDACKLAYLYAGGVLRMVRVPTREEETVRAVVRLREDLTLDMTRVQRLMTLRGIALYSAMVLATEIGDPGRFGEAPRLMSYFGLVPREHSSGDTRRTGTITKAGSRRARWILTEAAWNQRCKPNDSEVLRKRRQGQPAAVVAIAKKAEKRLHSKFWKVAL